MIPKELAKKIRYIQIYTSKVVNDILAGEYHSVFKGHGMEFDEVRTYVPGDDIRSIDWNVTARSGQPYIKRYVEERELTLYFLVDLSASGEFGSVSKNKTTVATELCALLAFSALKNNDKVGLIAFTDRVELFIPPAKGVSHVLRLIRDLLSFTPSHSGTRIAAGLEYLGRVCKKRAVVFLISDFQCDGYKRSLGIMAKRHDVIALAVFDPHELELPDCGLVWLEDAETGECILLDSSNAAVRKRFLQSGQIVRKELKERIRALGVDYAEIYCGRDYTKDLIRLFRSREHRAAL